MNIKENIKKFFLPSTGSPRWMYFMPAGVVVVLGIILLVGGTYAWDYSNSPSFCGTTCHTMPPEYATYLKSPHSNVTCEECHIGRAFIGEQLIRKSIGLKESWDMMFNLYTYPIYAEALRPARDTCEKCHQPETFTNDSLRKITHFANDDQNTPQSIYLILKTGGGAKRDGLGRGIHWHIVNKVQYYSADSQSQTIPYVRVTNDDGSTTEYVDVEANFDPKTIDDSQLRDIDCITCHNRVTHNFMPPSQSVDSAMARKVIDPNIPDIHQKAVDVLSATYGSHDEAMQAISALEDSYKNTDYYAAHKDNVLAAIQAIKDIFDQSVFYDQKVDWRTHANNLGHINAPGCFRCHDGKHLDAQQQAIPLECNLCHSIPIVAGPKDLVTNIEINSSGLEPDSHHNPNWISLHNKVFDATCSNCHKTDDPGGTSNTSFCSNSACHGNVFTYAGFDAPKLRTILQAQLPTPQPTSPPPPVNGTPTFDANIGPMLASKCTLCHGETPPLGLSFLTYADIMKGSENGPVIVPGDSANSKIVIIQSATHFANLSEEELNILKQWIDAGAPEN